MLFKFCLLFVALAIRGIKGDNDNNQVINQHQQLERELMTYNVQINSTDNCTWTIEGFTWQFNETIDKIITGINAAKCSEICMSTPWCKGYTWELEDSTGNMCALFHELNNQHPCSECSQCVSGIFTPIKGVCSATASQIVGMHSSSSELSCLESCAQNSHCNFYAWGKGSTFPRVCFMFSHCSTTIICEGEWETGEKTCITIPRVTTPTTSLSTAETSTLTSKIPTTTETITSTESKTSTITKTTTSTTTSVSTITTTITTTKTTTTTTTTTTKTTTTTITTTTTTTTTITTTTTTTTTVPFPLPRCRSILPSS